MEPLDEESMRWLAERAKVAEAKRAEYNNNHRALMAARKLDAARRFLRTMPPTISSREQNFVSIYDASEAAQSASGVIVEGVVFDIYNVMCGQMDGSSDFMAFDLITAKEEISSWRLNDLQIKRGSRVRIKFIDKNHYGPSDDHIDDVVLEVWIVEDKTTT